MANLHRLMLILVVFSLAQLALVSGVLFGKVRVYVINNLESGKKLHMHCQSGDDDLGKHVIGHKDYFKWSFYNNIWDTTLFWCDFEWQHSSGATVVGTFNIYDAMRDQPRCYTTCEWKVQRTGVYAFNLNTRKWERLYRWLLPDGLATHG
ncbi:hypothetical protein L1049_009154 [Liquidambar formosana]